MANKIQLIIEADDQASAKFKRIVSGLEKGLSSTDVEAKKLTSTTTQLGNTLKWAGGFLATYFGARAIGSITRGVIEAGASFEQMRIQLDTLTKGRGQETLDALNQWAKDMPVNTEKAVESFIMMRAMGLQPTIEDMTTLVDATSALGGTPEVMQGIARALGQIQTKGKASAEELMQLAERGIPAYEILREKLGLTAEQVANIGKEGIAGDKAVRALLEGMAERFGGQSRRMQETWRGMVEALRSEWVDFQKNIAEAEGLESAKQAIKSLLDTIRQLEREGTLQAWAEAISTVMATSIRWVQDAIGFWTQFFNIGIDKQIVGVRAEIEAIQKAISEGGVWDVSAEGGAVLIKTTEQLKLELFYLNQELTGLIAQQQQYRSGQTDLQVDIPATTTAISDQTNAIINQNAAMQDTLNKVGPLAEGLAAYKQRQEDLKAVGLDEGGEEYSPLSIIFPSVEEFEEQSEELQESMLGHYQGLSSAQASYLANYVKDWQKANKDITKDDATKQKMLQQQTLQTAQLQMQTAQLVAQTMIAISGEEHGALFYMARAFAVVQAIINSWLGYTQALAHPPGPPTTIPIAKWTLGVGLASAALIAGQTFAGKQKGGWLEGGSGTRDDLYIGTVGQTAYLAQGGEFIVNKRAAEENAGLLEAINEGRLVTGGGSPEPIVLHNYITIELEGERLGEFIDERVYESSKAGRRIAHTRGIVTG